MCWRLFRGRERDLLAGRLVVSFGAFCRIFDNLVLKKGKRGRRGLVRAQRILREEGSCAVKRLRRLRFSENSQTLVFELWLAFRGWFGLWDRRV